MASSASVWVSVAISPICMSFLMISADEICRYSATSLTVDPELTRMVSGACALACASGDGLDLDVAPPAAAAARGTPLRAGTGAAGAAAGPGAAPGGLRVDDDATDATAGGPALAGQAGAVGALAAATAAIGVALLAGRLLLALALLLRAPRGRVHGRRRRAGPSPVPSGRPRPGPVWICGRERCGAPLPLGSGLPVMAATAVSSSTAEAAALTLMPAFSSRLTISAAGRSNCRASSLTRFFAMCEPSLRCRGRPSPGLGRRG